MAEPKAQPDIRARSIGALAHPDLAQAKVDELEALYDLLDFLREHANSVLSHVLDQLHVLPDRWDDGAVPARPDIAATERAIDAALVTIYRRIGFRRRADRVIVPLTDAQPGLRPGDIYHGVGFVGPRCESPVCPAPHDVGGRHPAGWSV